MGGSTGAVVDRSARYDRWQLVIGVAAAAAAAWVGLVSQGPWAAPARASLAVLAIAVAFITYRKNRNSADVTRQAHDDKRVLAAELEAERRRTLTTTQGVLQSVALTVREMAAMPTDAARLKRESVTVQILAGAVDFLTADAPRVSYFRLDELDEVFEVDWTTDPSRARVMRPFPYSGQRGRLDPPTRVFTEGGDDDQDVWNILASDQPRIVTDIATDAPPGFDLSRHRAYDTYITVAVRADGIPFGVLTANATNAGDLIRLNEYTLGVLARLLAASEAIALGATRLNRLRERNTARAGATVGPDDVTLTTPRKAIS